MTWATVVHRHRLSATVIKLEHATKRELGPSANTSVKPTSDV